MVGYRVNRGGNRLGQMRVPESLQVVDGEVNVFNAKDFEWHMRSPYCLKKHYQAYGILIFQSEDTRHPRLESFADFVEEICQRAIV
jgi:hypothetical protein